MGTLRVLVATMCIGALGCSTVQDNPRTAKGAGIGAVAGAGLGAATAAIFGKDPGKGAAAGAVLGTATGATVGYTMDQRARDMERVLAAQGYTDARVARLENSYLVSLSGDTLFDTDSAILRPGQYSRLNRVAAEIAKYPGATVAVVGHTDSTGSENYNLGLSMKRAEAVSGALIAGGLHPSQVSTEGKGEAAPVASNETATGRAANRRVEILVQPGSSG